MSGSATLTIELSMTCISAARTTANGDEVLVRIAEVGRGRLMDGNRRRSFRSDDGFFVLNEN